MTTTDTTLAHTDSRAKAMPSIEELNFALTQVNQKLHYGLWATHGSYVGFLLLMSWAHLQTVLYSVKLLLVKNFLLLIFIPGFVKKKYRTYSWLCFAILAYFIWIIPYVMGRGNTSDWLLCLLTVVMFIAAMMTSRWMQQQSYLGWQIANTPTHTTAP